MKKYQRKKVILSLILLLLLTSLMLSQNLSRHLSQCHSRKYKLLCSQPSLSQQHKHQLPSQQPLNLYLTRQLKKQLNLKPPRRQSLKLLKRLLKQQELLLKICWVVQ